MPGTLALECRKCTRTESFTAPTIAEAVEAAKARGWVMLRDGVYACPKCPAPRYTTPARRKEPSHVL